MDRELVNQVSGIDVVIGSHSQSIIANSWASEGPIVAQAGKEGYHVGVIVLEEDADGNLSHSGYSRTMSQKMPDSERIMDLIHEYEQKTGHINRNKMKYRKSQ
jgi:2',3'-cyclic-nucleotide 2'-phosphodiesterase (5'-nucleotidase family)